MVVLVGVVCVCSAVQRAPVFVNNNIIYYHVYGGLKQCP
jgi:hypothetical protein